MSDYTKINFADIEDMAAGRGVDLEARFGRSHIESEHLGVTRFRYGPDSRPPYGHRHREQEEVYVVTSGSGRARLGDEIIELKQWDVLRVAPQVWRAFQAGTDGLELLAIGNDRPEGGDGEMDQNFWTD
jgi:mannose-6-phosphate isomerase-like protein (cupin superfamily)